MPFTTNKTYPWIIIGAGPAGLASAGLLLESGVARQDILLIDPEFKVGDFGKYWGEVSSNTSIQLFLKFLSQIQGFSFNQRPAPFPLEARPLDGFCQLKEVTEALQWVTNHLRNNINTIQGYVDNLQSHNNIWQLNLNNKTYHAHKVILATGATPKSLSHTNTEQISLYTALNPPKLKQAINPNDCVAVFGSSHSSMIIMKNLLDAGVNNIINFYLSPPRYAIRMDGWTLYDNTGLKANTAQWARINISQQLNPLIKCYISNKQNIKQHMPACNKAIYPVGFKARHPLIVGVDANHYDPKTGIIAPGLFGTGIAFPRLKTDPLGNQEFNVGLYKFLSKLGQF